MKINDQENINRIHLTHKGKSIKFECFTKPFPCTESLYLAEPKSVEIIFDDLMEVESLINILERFKKETQEYIGIWKG